MATWLSGVRSLEIIFSPDRMAAMLSPILGVVLHTTNTGETKLEGYQSAWRATNHQGAHFAIDRDGNVAQYRALEDGIGHITGAFNNRYFGIEHFATWKQGLTDAQIDASAKLVATLANKLGFPIAAINKAGESGIGFHKQFNHTHCGEAVFCAVDASARGTDPNDAINRSLRSFDQVIDAAQAIQMGC
jgi:hypothetical protein